MKTYAYIGLSNYSSLSEQLKKITAYDCDDYFIEKDETIMRGELENLLEMISVNDRVVVEDIRTFGMSIQELSELTSTFHTMNIKLISISDQIDSTEKVSFNKMILLFAKWLKEDSSVERKSKELGRPTIGEAKASQIRFLYNHNKMTMREIANACGVSLGTVHKYINQNS